MVLLVKKLTPESFKMFLLFQIARINVNKIEEKYSTTWFVKLTMLQQAFEAL